MLWVGSVNGRLGLRLAKQEKRLSSPNLGHRVELKGVVAKYSAQRGSGWAAGMLTWEKNNTGRAGLWQKTPCPGELSS